MKYKMKDECLQEPLGVPTGNLSKRQEKAQILCDELYYWGLISYETDMRAVKVIANELPWSILMRVVHKLQRCRKESEK